MNSFSRVAVLSLCILASAFLADPKAEAQTETILHNFQKLLTANDGSQPPAPVVEGADGNYYGVTSSGGSANAGTVFQITPAGVTTVLHSFNDGSVLGDGDYPQSLMLASDGNFYGICRSGGTGGEGTAFMMTPAGAVTILHSFDDGTVTNDGETPTGSLLQARDGNLYGVTQNGGAKDDGTVFQITLSGACSILHSFDTASSGLYHPNGGLIQGSGSDNTFYGTTINGGSSNWGGVFNISSSGTYLLLHKFSGTNSGIAPQGPLVHGSDGSLYGTTGEGGTDGEGIVFKMTTAGVITVVHNFGTVTNDGDTPSAGLVLGTDGNFYGTTYAGGLNGYGAVFKVTSSGTITILHSFSYTGGDSPEAALFQGSDGNFYGTTSYDGTFAAGTVFQITSTAGYTLLHTFLEPETPNDGQTPQSPVVLGTNGNLYGTTQTGGVGYGTVYQTTPAGTTTILHSFNNSQPINDGAYPYAGLVQGTDGNFYGTTLSSPGSVFKMTPAGVVTVLHSFTGSNDGRSPYGKLALGTDGNFYGTTYSGGTGGYGTIYKISSTGTYSVLHNFTNSQGSYTDNGLIQGLDGNFYGTTPQGGSHNCGVAFEITPAGTFTVLHTFNDVSSDGAYPACELLQGADGNFYGTSESGGSADNGTLFKMTAAGAITILHSFGDNSVIDDGLEPQAGLTRLIDGNFAGTTYSGGANSYGTVFEITPAGVETILHNFNDGSVSNDGNRPVAKVIEDSTGILYGTTLYGGLEGDGTVFNIVKPAQTLTFPAIGDHYVNDAPFTIGATASSGLTPVTFSVLSGPATISGSTVTLTGAAGTVLVQASQVGDPNNAPVTTTQSFNVNLVPQTITFGSLPNATYGDAPITLTATASSGLTVTFSASGPATVSGNTLTITGGGAVTVTANQAGNGTYAVAPAVQQSFTVNPETQNITFSTLVNHTYGDAPFTVSASASSGLAPTFSVISGPASISGSTVTITGGGTVVIGANQAGNTNFAAATQVNQSFTVNPANQTITFSAIPTHTSADAPFNLNATSSSGLGVIYTVTSGPASVSGNTVTLSGTGGTVTIQASQTGNASYNAATPVSQSFTVTTAQTITFSTIGSHTYGDVPFALSATASSGLSVSFSIVSGPATLSGSTVTLTAAGSVTIQASQAGNSTYAAAPNVSQTFTINKASQTITFPAIPTHTYGDAPFTISATASSGSTPTFSVVSGPATISGNSVNLTGAGTVTVGANQVGNANYNAATQVNQSFTVAKESQTITFGAISDQTLSTTIVNLTSTTSSGLPTTYTVTGPATVSGSTLTLTEQGTVNVTATQPGNSNYAAATSIKQSFHVNKAAQTIAFANIPNQQYAQPNGTVTLTATASSGLPITYSITSGPATVSGNVLTITGVATVTVKAVQSGNADYNPAASVSKHITVTKANQTITFPAVPEQTYTVPNGTVTLSATASSGLPITYQLTSGPGTLSGNTLTITGKATVTVKAVQAGTTNYNPAPSVSVHITVH